MKTKLVVLYIISTSIFANCQDANNSKGCVRRSEILKYDSTHIKSESWFCGQVVDSVYREWYKSGELKIDGFYNNGVKEGMWKIVDFGSTDHKFGYMTIQEYKNGFLSEERIYEFRNDVSNIVKLNMFYYDKNTRDTLEVERHFYPQTGIMTFMDTLVNGFSNGTERLWNEKNGKLMEETHFIKGECVYKITYQDDNKKMRQNFYSNNTTVKDEYFYDANGTLTEERHYDEKGKLLSTKKY